jgi:small subunit ribosomal protein S11
MGITTPRQRANKKLERRKAKRRRRRLGKKPRVLLGVAHISATFTNCIVTISDLSGNALCWSSSGKCKFKGRKKRSHGAAGSVGRDVGKMAVRQCRMRKILVIIRGVGRCRVAVVKGLMATGLKVSRIKDRTPRAFNGCRPRKRRRV